MNDLKTSKQLRPGVVDDVLTIPIYQVDDFSEAEGKTASLYEHVADVVVTGDDVVCLIPADSVVDVTLKADSSERMKLEVHFFASDFTVEKVLDTNKKQSASDDEIQKGLNDAEISLRRLETENISTSELQTQFDSVKKEFANSSEKKAVLQHLKEVLRGIERLDSSTEWQRIEKNLREEFERLERAQSDLGNDKTAQLVEQLRTQTDKVIRDKDVRMGHELLEQISALFVHLTMVYQCMGLIQDCHRRFGGIRWKDSSRARQLINKGLEEMNGQPTVEKLHPIACSLIELMPDDEAANASGLLR